jgi:hypothetical protein
MVVMIILMNLLSTGCLRSYSQSPKGRLFQYKVRNRWYQDKILELD